MSDSKRATRSVSEEAKRIGRKLRRTRKAMRLSVEETAKRAELSKNHLYVLERGEMMPSLPTLGRLAKVLGVTRESLLAAARRGNGDNGNGGRSR